MANLECLACGHGNKVGDESCASCSSPLDLKLCNACDAINASNAHRCHGCAALLGAEAELAASPASVLSAIWVLSGQLTGRDRWLSRWQARRRQARPPLRLFP